MLDQEMVQIEWSERAADVLVAKVTDDKSLPKLEHKRLKIEATPPNPTTPNA